MNDGRPFIWENKSAAEKKAMEQAALKICNEFDANRSTRKTVKPSVKNTTQSNGDGKGPHAEASQENGSDNLLSFDSFDSLDSYANWPKKPASIAYHGVAGHAVRIILPHTEASPVALLLQFLTAYGNAIGRSAHRVIGGSRHHTNLFAALVGRTSRGRKGTSWAWIENLFDHDDLDPD
jgi:hypothetical protein